MLRQKINRNLLNSLSATAFMVVAICSLGQIASAENPAQKKMMPGKSTEQCAEMKQQHQKMAEEMKAHDLQIEELVAKMNAEPQEQKVALMADIITRMAAQRSAMHRHMNEMKSSCMKHMAKGGQDKSGCPMMEAM